MSKKINLLFITQYFYPDLTAAAFRSFSIYKVLSEKGINVTVITTFPHRSDVKINSKLKNVRRIKIKRGNSESIFYYLEFFLKALPLIIREAIKSNIIFATSPPITVAVEALLVSKILRKKFILDIRDLWPDTIVDVGKLKRHGLMYFLLKFIEKFIYTRADYISCVSKEMSNYILKYNKNITVVYNGVFYEDYIKFCKADQTLPKGNDNKVSLNIYYAGNVGLAQKFDFLLQVANKLNPSREFIFHIIGRGVQLEKYKDFVRKHSLNNVFFHKQMEREILLKYLLKEADALLLTVNDGWSFTKTIPSKLFDYLLLRKPILYHLSGEGDSILKMTKSAIKFKLTPEDFLAAIYKLKANFTELRINSLTKNCRILKKFIREKENQKLLDIIKDLFKEKP